MRTRLSTASSVVASVLVLSLGAVACGQAEQVGDAVGEAVDQASEAADQVREQAEEVATLARFCTAAARTAEAVNAQDWDAAIEHGETMVAEAPDDIVTDARTVLDGAKAYRDGDQQAVMSEEFQGAAERVKAYAEDHCDPTS